MSIHPRGIALHQPDGFDYSSLNEALAAKARAAAARIKGRTKQILLDNVATGLDLIEMKDSLPYGQYEPWLRAEFAWTEKTAFNFRTVAAWLGDKVEMISNLHIAPTGAYLLAAKSTPESARAEALERAFLGEKITPAIAREIVERALAEAMMEPGEVPVYMLRFRLARLLASHRNRWPEQALPEMAEQLQEFAAVLQGSQAGKDAASERA